MLTIRLLLLFISVVFWLSTPTRHGSRKCWFQARRGSMRERHKFLMAAKIYDYMSTFDFAHSFVLCFELYVTVTCSGTTATPTAIRHSRHCTAAVPSCCNIKAVLLYRLYVLRSTIHAKSSLVKFTRKCPLAVLQCLPGTWHREHIDTTIIGLDCNCATHVGCCVQEQTSDNPGAGVGHARKL